MRGIVTLHPRGFGFITANDGSSAFVAPPDLNAFLADDVVDAVVDQSGGRTQARALHLVERARDRLFGTVVKRAGQTWLRVDRATANTDWLLEPGTLGAAALVEHAPVVAVIVSGAGDRRVRALSVCSADEAPVERLLARHRLRGAHRDDVLQAAVRATLPERGARRDLRDVVTVTIDAPVSRDLDDALSALPPAPDGALRVLVSIADVDAVVTAGSALDDDARARGTSVYLPGRVLPMLPHTLSEDLLSLNEGEERLTLTVELRIDHEGTVTATDIATSIIRSHARLSYDDVAAFLVQGEHDRVPTHTHETLRRLHAASARLSVARAARGGVEVAREEASIRLDDSGDVASVEMKPSTQAHVLVERLMVAANEAVARWLVERGLPGVFRVHDAPDAERVEALAAVAASHGLVAAFPLGKPLSPTALSAFEHQFRDTAVQAPMAAAMRRLLGPARYQVEPSPHFGLAAPLYLHFTSPIRRYADLAVHRIVKAYLDGARDLHGHHAELAALATHLDDAARRADRAEGERVRSLTARLFARRVGEVMSGVVVGHRPGTWLVQLPGAVAGLASDDAAPLGRAIVVRVLGADEELGRIDVERA